MYKIKIFPIIEDEHLKYFLEKIKDDKLTGCQDEIHNYRFNRLNDVSHKVKELIIINEEMWAIIEFVDTKIGNHMKSIINSLGENSSYLKEFFIDGNNLGLNIYPINNISRGVVL
jgi:hypothetical protein